MRILITGAGGFLGRRLATHLVDSGHDVFGTYLDTLTPPAGLEGVEMVPADILSSEALAVAMEQAQPDAVIHLAGFSHVGNSWSRPGDYFQVNVQGAENVFVAAGDRLVLFASSAEVYGRVPEDEQPIAETRAVNPSNPYALTKAAAERLALSRDSVVVRMFNVVGPGQSPNFSLPSFARQLAEVDAGRREAVKTGNLGARRDFLPIDDAVAAYQLLLEQGERGQVYNLGSGTALSIAEALDILREVSGVDCAIETDPSRVRPVDIELYQADVGKLSELGWRQTQSLQDALYALWADVAAVPA